MSPMTSETRPIMTANAMRNARKAGGTPWVPFPERLERLEKLELKFPPISAKKATAASLKNVRHRKGRARKSRVRWRAGPMASLALSGLIMLHLRSVLPVAGRDEAELVQSQGPVARECRPAAGSGRRESIARRLGRRR